VFSLRAMRNSGESGVQLVLGQPKKRTDKIGRGRVLHSGRSTRLVQIRFNQFVSTCHTAYFLN
jgi:hypothetical protein